MSTDKSMTNGSEQKRDERTRNWTVVVYPESAPENWRDLLDELHMPWIESPLHNMDSDANGELKKEHWHVMLAFEGKKSFAQVKEITDMLNAPIPQKTASARALVRYMAHLDNPDKVQYSSADIIGHGGADVADYLRPTSSARYVLIREMVAYIQQENIGEFIDLATYAMNERFDDWWPLLCDNAAYIVGQVIKSQRWNGTKGRRDNEG